MQSINETAREETAWQPWWKDEEAWRTYLCSVSGEELSRIEPTRCWNRMQRKVHADLLATSEKPSSLQSWRAMLCMCSLVNQAHPVRQYEWQNEWPANVIWCEMVYKTLSRLNKGESEEAQIPISVYVHFANADAAHVEMKRSSFRRPVANFHYICEAAERPKA